MIVRVLDHLHSAIALWGSPSLYDLTDDENGPLVSDFSYTVKPQIVWTTQETVELSIMDVSRSSYPSPFFSFFSSLDFVLEDMEGSTVISTGTGVDVSYFISFHSLYNTLFTLRRGT